jgi:Tol biopolymer transport system component
VRTTQLLLRHHTLFPETNRPVNSAPTEQSGKRWRATSVMRRYLFPCLALATLVRVQASVAQTVAEVQVTPETMTLGVGQKQTLFATAFDQRGNLIQAAKFTFWSSDTLVAQVRKDGTVVGLKPGLAKIEARYQGRRASMAILITGSASSEGRAARTQDAAVLTLEPASLSLFPGESVRIVAHGMRSDGAPAALGPVTVKSLKPEIARVDTGGMVTGVAPGRAILQATSGRLQATLPVDVSQAEFVVSPSKILLGPGGTDTLRALVPSQGNREIRGMLQWRSSDSAVVSVTPSGIVRARSAGQAEIIAAGLGQERKATVAVHRVPDALVVSPPQAGPLQVPLRATREFTAVAESADSTPIPEARVSWELSDTTVAGFDPATGVLTPKALGTTTLTARLAGITPAVWTIQVVAGEIGVEPSRVGLLVGQRTTLSALLRDQAGAGGRAPPVRWSSDRPEVATVRETGGVVDAVSPGHAGVSATTPWGKKASADVFVVGDLFLSSNRAGTYGIYQMRAPGPTNLLPVLVDSITNIQAALAPDRTRVAFSSNRNGSFDIYVMDADGQNLRRVTTNPGNEGEPAWTPDGARIVYTSTTGTNSQIAIMFADGGDNRPLTIASGGNHSPAVSGDGRTIAFVSARDGNHAIYTMNLDGSNQRRLIKSSARQTNPRYFRNGDLAYVMERGGGSKGSKVMRLSAGGGESQLLQTEQPIAALAVSRDGDRLAYVLGRIKDAAKGRVDYSLFLQSTAPGSTAVVIPLQPGEQIVSPSF